MNAIAVFTGGHVRTGLEDNPTLDAERRVPRPTPRWWSASSQLAGIAGRPVATAAQTRALLGL